MPTRNPDDDANGDAAADSAPPADLQDRVQLALRHWHSRTRASSPLAYLHCFRQLHPQPLADPHLATNQLLHQALQLLAERHPQDAELLQRTTLDNEANHRVAVQMNVAESTLFRYKQRAVTRLTACVWELELQSRRMSSRRLLSRLGPPSPLPLLGGDAHLRHLAPLLQADGPPWIVALAGMGGIGKTTLADAVVRHLIEQGTVQALGWVTARQTVLGWDGQLRTLPNATLTLAALAEELCQQLLEVAPPLNPQAAPTGVAQLSGALRARLKAQPHLVVIDNIETVQDVELVVAALRDLAAPTKFLLTTRIGLFDQPDVYHYAVPELSAPHALALLRQEAALRNIPPLLHATDAELQPILEIVGGNPLALRLVVGMTHVHALPQVLEHLTQRVPAGRGLHSASLYTYLYREAWDALDETARRAWLVMPLIPAEGADLTRLAQLSDLEPAALAAAMTLLVRLNLVDARGDLHQRRYSIHALTRAFLHDHVLQWT